MNHSQLIDIVKSDDFLVLDSETTGVDTNAEMVSLAIINSKGFPLMDTLIRPMSPIPQGATNIHGITDAMVEQAKRFPYSEIASIINGKQVVIFNADFDVAMLYRSMKAAYPQVYIDWREMATFHCAMLEFARIYGDWDYRRKSYRWKKLDVACDYYHIQRQGAHNALVDCLDTLKVCQAMIGIRPAAEVAQEELPF